jgi:hypothetical protein
MYRMLLMLMILLPSAASAHVVNDQTIYEDIQYSAVKEQIVILSGLGVIPYEHGASLFKPGDKLTRKELALWAGTFLQIKPANTPTDEIVKAALDKGIVTSVQGNATYKEVDQAFFQGQAKIGRTDEELTREALIVMMKPYLEQKVNGHTLYEMAGFTPGPSGKVEDVTTKDMKDKDGKAVKASILQINGKSFVLGAHPKIIQASVDPTVWKGKNIISSWSTKEDGTTEQLQLVTFEQQSANQAAKGDDSQPSTHNHAGHSSESDTAQTAVSPGFPYFPAVIGALFVLLAVWLFAKRKRKMV